MHVWRILITCSKIVTQMWNHIRETYWTANVHDHYTTTRVPLVTLTKIIPKCRYMDPPFDWSPTGSDGHGQG